MSEYRLDPAPALGGFDRTVGDTTVTEVTGLSIVSISVPSGGRSALGVAMKTAYGAEFPPPGGSTASQNGLVRFLWMSPDQVFALFDHAGDDGDLVVAAQLGKAGYYTLQSDNWVVLRLIGGHARAALERICQIDIDPRNFPRTAVARTVMEHIGSIIVAEGDDSFLLLSAWSSAHSFLDAVMTSVENVA